MHNGMSLSHERQATQGGPQCGDLTPQVHRSMRGRLSARESAMRGRSFIGSECWGDTEGCIEASLSEEGVESRMNEVSEEQLQQLNIDYSLSEPSRALCRVGSSFEELFDDNDPTDDEKTRVESDLESDADEEED
ncbi:hypothetical protein HAX54_036675 [Datura stramonium]|uniref:Uncharacterized protein n=1 Tax=Datura stramonium TaxID=4076 RepID=A0ABS8SGC6_DATST|nr:hypothetical protein [Datura stramonium]